MNVAVYGIPLGSYRTQNLLKALLTIQNLHVFYINYQELWGESSVFSRITGIHKVIQLIMEIIILLKCDIIIIPAMTHQINYRYKIAKLLNKKIITDFYISYYDSYVNDLNVEKNSKDSLRHFKLDRQAILSSDIVIFLNSAEASYYTSILNLDLSKINFEIIPLCVDDRIHAKRNYANGIGSKFKICWWGTYIPLHGIDKILQSIKIISENNTDFELFLFGNSEEKSAPFKTKIIELGIEKYVQIINSKSFDNGELEPFLENHCDLALGSFGDSSKAKTVFVNKIADAFAMGLPVLTMKTDAMKDLISTETDVITCENTAADIAVAISLLMHDKNRLLQVGNNGYIKYNQLFSFRAFKPRVESLLAKAISKATFSKTVY